ncbi:nuclear transport factor 2 family protein [Capnocytophaga granulosa]|uniref:nuclear transport factor 2 family protein n=1 Tax=Capnocytophaga granulosa TaxID=45242 RepID=UPI0023F4C5BC|nr:nuclear transport factor 2 family protein [Capnocytophaga granulosa]
MKNIITILLLSFSFITYAQQSPQETKVLQLSENLWKAMQQVDKQTLVENIVAEAVFVHMGATLVRDKEIEVLQQKGIVLKEVATENTSVRIVGKTAVLLRKLRLTAIVGGNEVVNPFVVTETYTKKGSKWQLLSLSYTKIIY